MKICWDTLERLLFTKHCNFRDINKNVTYHYTEFCVNCGNPFLSAAGREIFCDIWCATSYNGKNRVGIPLSEETKNKISKKALKRGKFTKEHCKAISKGMLKENHRSWKGGLKNKNMVGYKTYSNQLFDDQTRPNSLDNRILQVKCKYCGKWFNPTITQIKGRLSAINGKSTEGAEQNLYCSDGCKQSCPIFHQKQYPKGFKKSTSREVQPELRQLVLLRDDYTCQKCGKYEDVQLHCHHILPINESPIESADVSNCITLCKSCHKKVHKIPDCNYHELRCSNEIY